MFRIDRPFANYAAGVVNPICGNLSGTANCQAFQITGDQVNYGIEGMVSGRLTDSLVVSAGITVLNPKLTDTGVAVTNDRNFVGIPDFKSNILTEYRVPKLVGTFLNFDWQHVGRRPIDDINSAYVPQYNLFDFGVRYTRKVFGKVTTWRVTANNATNVHYWSTIAPGGVTGQSHGQLSRPRRRAPALHGVHEVCILSDMRPLLIALALSLAPAAAQTTKCVPPSGQQVIIYPRRQPDAGVQAS